MHLLFNFLFLMAGFKWGDWKNWREYYPTILFFIGGDLLKNFLFHYYHMWQYKETILAENFLIGHPAINLMIIAIYYPATILIFLGHYPKERQKTGGLDCFLGVFIQHHRICQPLLFRFNRTFQWVVDGLVHSL